ncbi:MAG: AAA domain-containing protein, partial [Myxococcota bacterium]|nr:AAA domain-containing protein [Myxococcota bacterium]
MPKPPFGVSPSAIARYFFHDCHRFLWLKSCTQPAQLGLPDKRWDASPAMKAVLESGAEWEEEVLELLGQRALIAPAEAQAPRSQRTWSLADSLALLALAKPGQYLYQPTLRAPASFYQRLGLDSSVIGIRDNRPDLIKVTEHLGERRLRVIDIKRGEHLRSAYQMQILFYALELEAIVQEYNVQARVELDEGDVWLGAQPHATPVSLTAVREYLEQLLATLPALFGAPLEQAEWHLRYRCEWCDYFPYCFQEAISAGDVSLLPGLSAHGKRFLAAELGVHTLSQLEAALCASPDLDERLSRCASLNGERPRLQARVNAFNSKKPVVFGNKHPAFPLSQSCAIYVTVQTEPVRRRVWGAAWLLQAWDNVREALFADPRGGPSKPVTWLAREPEQALPMRRAFIASLWELLSSVDQYNASTADWKARFSVQLYCYSERERAALLQWLLEAIYDEEPEAAQTAMNVLFYVHGPDMMKLDEHPEAVPFHPIIDVVSAMGKLLAVPVPVAYTLPESLSAMGSRFTYNRSPAHHFPLGHGLRSDAITLAWSGQPAELDGLERALSTFLWAVKAAAETLRQLAKPQLFAYPPKLSLSGAAPLTHPRLSRLRFFALHEAIAQCLDLRAQRCLSPELMRAKGKRIELLCITSDYFEVLSESLIISAEGFPNRLLVRDDDEGMAAQLKFNDWALRSCAQQRAYGDALSLAGIERVECDELGFATHLLLQHALPTAQPGQYFVLMERFTDFNTERLLSRLAEHAQTLEKGCSLLSSLLDAPAAAASPVDDEPAFIAQCEGALQGLTPSQVKAWQQVLRHRVTAVWGPPGTGKTHLLAAMVVGLLRAAQRAQTPMRVLLSAFTHAAIENLMRKLVALMDDELAAVPVFKVGDWKGQAKPALVEELGKKPEQLDARLAATELLILGSTVWGVGRCEARFELVVIDEGSQLKVSESVLAILRVAEQGRLVVAGDHEQLGPIIKGVYEEPPPAEPILHGSLFELLRGRDTFEGLELQQLLENFRMCDVLTKVSQAIYSD